MKSLYALIVIAFFVGAGTACAEDIPENRWLLKSQEPGATALQRQVYEQLARINSLSLPTMVPPIVLWAPSGECDPMSVIYRLGIKTVPILAEALEDATPTRTRLPSRNGNQDCSRPWRVSDAAGLLIRHLTDRDFAVTESKEEIHLYEVGRYPELGTRFRELVHAWYSKNGSKTPEERKIEEVQDDLLQNRLHAMEWIGTHRVYQGRDALIKRVNDIFAEKSVNSTQDAELSACALTLGQLNDTGSVRYVSKICDRFAYWIYMAYRPAEQGRSSMGSQQLQNLFKAFQGWALLGHKDAALTKLRELYIAYSDEMEPSTRDAYTKRLEGAAKW